MRLGACLVVGTWLCVIALPAAGDFAALEGALSDAELEGERAMSDVGTLQMTRVTSNAYMSNTYIERGVSGDNILAPGALAHAQGISTVIQNSGHNVIIQDSTVINLNMAP
ncbi:hypothetical protein M911_15310 [Ectothiorhodospira haloalkaliphila]|uniref:Uncharacterized protein n=2 Tax=Ectothiorhodospira haloalkaliphila TaxID=421628 RepID=W8L8X7_9GAMM|nr:hypothetical protein M911_15310 [Ectothiorhodospira haloalkaliphila]